MIYLGIDFGTAFTKAALHDTNSDLTTLVALNSKTFNCGLGNNAYAMPTAAYVLTRNGVNTIYLGEEAINMRLLPGGKFFENFKVDIDNQEEFICTSPRITYQELVTELFRYIYDKSLLCCENNPIDKVVLTVPASSVVGGYRWDFMETCAQLAGFTAIDIIYEPEAAAYCLVGNHLRDKDDDNTYSLIYDFGGGTFDTCLVKQKDEQIFVIDKSIGSDNKQHWGGMYIDASIRANLIANNSVAKQYARDLQSKDIPLEDLLSKEDFLRTEPVNAKIHLSSNSIFYGSIGNYELSRDTFVSLVSHMLDETIECSKGLVKNNCLEEELELKDIKKIYLVGGSSRIPYIESKWNDVMKEEQVAFAIEKSEIETVAIGAALYNKYHVSSERLIEIGCNKYYSSDYRTAALYFNKADTALGKYCLASLYYKGVLTKKGVYKKAANLYKESGSEDSLYMLAIMKYQGKGFLKNEDEAKNILDLIQNNECKTRLLAAINGDVNSFEYINTYDPFAYIIRKYDLNVENFNDSTDSEESEEDFLNYGNMMKKVDNDTLLNGSQFNGGGGFLKQVACSAAAALAVALANANKNQK